MPTWQMVSHSLKLSKPSWLVPPNCPAGSYHGFDSCSWLARTFRLCPQYGNDLYAFRNLADAKARCVHGIPKKKGRL